VCGTAWDDDDDDDDNDDDDDDSTELSIRQTPRDHSTSHNRQQRRATFKTRILMKTKYDRKQRTHSVATKASAILSSSVANKDLKIALDCCSGLRVPWLFKASRMTKNDYASSPNLPP
jgi:hypothetical protein